VEQECLAAEKRSGSIWTTAETVKMRQASNILLTITFLRDILSIDDTRDILETSTIHFTLNASEIELYSANNKIQRRRIHDRP